MNLFAFETAWGLLVGDKRRFGMMGTVYGWARLLIFMAAGSFSRSIFVVYVCG